MMESFLTVALAAILTPYGLIFVVLLWNVVGPLMRRRAEPGSWMEKRERGGERR